MKLINLVTTNVNFTELSTLCQPEDAILLRQDAVFLCLRHDITWPVQQLYLLEMDARVRQIPDTTGFTLINSARWVELTIAARVNLLWQS